MRTVIINRSSAKRVQFHKWLEGIEGEFILVTKDAYSNDFDSFFSSVIGFKDFADNDYIYSYIIDLNKTKEIDYIIALNEFDLLKAAYLREYLGIEGQNSESAMAFRDKVMMKDRLASVVQTPTYQRINHALDLIDFKQKHGLPLVVKPVDGAGSVGVEIIRDENDYRELLEKGIGSNLEVETFVLGEMYHVDGLYRDGELLLSHPSRYIHGCLAFQDSKFLGSVMLETDNELTARLNEAVHRVLDAMPTPGHTISFHAEFFHTEQNELVLCEIASRVGGGMIAEAMLAATGVDILGESARGQCGAPPSFQNASVNQLAGWILIPPKNGTLRALDLSYPYDWVVDYYTKEEYIGKTFDKASSSVDAYISLLVTGESEQQIEERFHIINKWFEDHTKWEFDQDKEGCDGLLSAASQH
ncbi:carboxylate--amine ligase [Paenibacillus sambharensis]|uniref:Carboxylate--amine ligase n=1 Tax=Paenibacillus sambharensis TaxID=1803190 RepID=A0A2W1LYN9_9BACL|nr:ATP-grasp domain-containing protein [Paenibacillus sambharensis]PZD96791.1 carboxylate--amine ligase [Paenibacillus sambharensis]